MIQSWGVLVILIASPLLGSLPIIAWITYALTGKKLSQIGTKNITVAAAFYHGGTWVGMLAVLSEALKGMSAVLLCRVFFTPGSAWELIALIGLVLGRYGVGRGAGTTNVVWGLLVHDPLVAIFTGLLAMIGMIVVRSRQWVKFGVLFLFPWLVLLLNIEDIPKIMAAVVLAGLLGWIYTIIPDDLNLPSPETDAKSQAVFTYLRGKHSILSLDDQLNPSVVGDKAATLSQIKRWGYPVPKGWVISPVDDPQELMAIVQPSNLSPVVVRSSAIGEDSQQASAAGQYITILNVTTSEQLIDAIAQVQASYNHPCAVQYRRDHGLPDMAMAVVVQQQIPSVYSGVAFSRDPISQQGDAIVIEALPGSPTQVVSGKVTPEQYRAFVVETDNVTSVQVVGEMSGREVEVPQALIKQVAYLVRQLEKEYHGLPQDMEWSYDGENIWVLQSRPITTLLPIWTRKIAAEVIPGVIHPLTWSINRPLTCGVWGDIFTVVLGDRSWGLDFTATATLHYSRAYFNASLLGEIFLRMGLPPESLEFLTRGAKMSKPPLKSTWENLPGLMRLLKRELSLETDFKRDYSQKFLPGLSELAHEPIEKLTAAQLLERIDSILELLRSTTYYSILVPLSVAFRQAIFRVKDENIDQSIAPEVAALRSLTALAAQAQQILPDCKPDQVLAELAKTAQGQQIIHDLHQFLEDYGYLSDVGTNIAVPTWKENPQPIKDLFVQLLQNRAQTDKPVKLRKRKPRLVQRRVDIKGRVTEIYSRLLAELRWRFVALEQSCLKSGLIHQSGDIFFLELNEVRRLVAGDDIELREDLSEIVEFRRWQFQQDSQLNQIPLLVYGHLPPHPLPPSSIYSDQVLHGIPASHGQAEGRIKVVRDLQQLPEIDRHTILVVPYTDSGWAPLLVRAGGLISEAGGRLSHGAIVAREYGIPAIMDVHNATWRLKDGQRVRIDGSRGIIELSNKLRSE